MTSWQIILATLIFLTGIRSASGQTFAPPPAGTPIHQPAPIIVAPGAQAAPVFPPQSTVVPLPSHTPGSVFGPPAAELPPISATTPVPAMIPGAVAQPPMVAAGPPNPISVPVVDEELAWDQIVDVVSDYFAVSREHRARRSGEVWTEGRIETAYQTGATWLEPQRGDSVGSFNRWESTFQTIRRRAVVRVVPDAAGYQVEVIVEKELEDLPNPERATAGAAMFRNDATLPSRRLEEVSRTRSSPRWLQLGRDPALEQRILAEIHARLAGVTTGLGPAMLP